MELGVLISIILAFAAGVGLIAAIYFIRAKANAQKLRERETDIIEKAKKEASEIKYHARKEAKDIAREEREILEKEIYKRQNDIKSQEIGMAKKEAVLDQKIEEKQREITEVRKKEEEIKLQRAKAVEEADKFRKKQEEVSTELSKVAQMTKEEAKNSLVNIMEEEAKVEFAKNLRRLEEEAREDSEKTSKRIIGIAIQRFAGEFVAEKAITSVDLPSDDLKGRLIGRDGRNIRAFEQICGVDLIIDDTPEIVVVSSFNVVRREIARLTLQKLIADGRIHPAKIEEFHDKSRSEMNKILLDMGQKAQMEIGVHGIHPEILKLVGALNWRTSYTQNQYQHALEAAFICGAMAQELGQNVKQARRAALLHDIGKVIDASAEGSHAVVGADFAKKYGESPEIVHAIRAHHDDEKPETILAHLVAASDALSGARPGARKAMVESYVSRLTDIEGIVNSFEGVSKSFAISGGREVRVFVENDKVSDEGAVLLSRDIAKKIEEEMSYPGTIKVTVLRETRAVGVAK
jgi:ribonuclease Y